MRRWTSTRKVQGSKEKTRAPRGSPLSPDCTRTLESYPQRSAPLTRHRQCLSFGLTERLWACDFSGMRKRSSKPRDINALAHSIVSQAIGNVPAPRDDGKNPAAVALGRLGGLKG